MHCGEDSQGQAGDIKTSGATECSQEHAEGYMLGKDCQEGALLGGNNDQNNI